jgi:hypothetical protein
MTQATGRGQRALILALACLGWGLGILTLPLDAAENQLGISAIGSVALGLTCGTVGTIVVWHQPRHPMGWILVGVADFFSLLGVATGYNTLDYGHHHGALPLGAVSLVASQSWAPGLVLFGLAFLVYPDGGAPSSRWRWVIRAYLVLGAAWVVGAWALAVSAVAAHDIHVSAGGDLTTGQNAPWFGWLSAVFFLGTAAAWLSWLVYQVVLWRRSSGERRLQMKWLMTGAAVCAVSGAVAVGWTGSPVVADIASLGLAALPVSIGVGILKFRLYDIDRIISRTLAYAIVTGVLVGMYVGLVLLATHVLPLTSGVAVAGSTLVAAALFNPLRRRVQHRVDRRFNRARYDAELIVAAFAARLKEALELDSVRDDLAGAVQLTLEPVSISLWLADDDLAGDSPAGR